MIAGIDFPDLFTSDRFADRRASGPGAGNPYDPESLITGAEEARGMTYYDKRDWPSESVYWRACSGRMTPDEIVRVAPRRRAPQATTSGDSTLGV